MKKILIAALTCTVLAPSLTFADVLCYRRDSQRDGNRNVVQIFAGDKCPKKYSKVSESALGQIQTDQGATGVTGAKGSQGPAGDQGSKGAPGDVGAKGVTGDVGDTGPQGDKGLQGPDGEKGDTGAQGVRGLQGDKGAQGDKGEKGDDGISAVGFFDFYGGSLGDTLVGGANYELQINEVIAPLVHGGALPAARSRSVPVGASCSQISYRVEMNGDANFQLSVGATNDAFLAATTLCTSGNCSGTKNISIGAGELLSLHVEQVSVGTPATRASWNITCVAP